LRPVYLGLLSPGRWPSTKSLSRTGADPKIGDLTIGQEHRAVVISVGV